MPNRRRHFFLSAHPGAIALIDRGVGPSNDCPYPGRYFARKVLAAQAAGAKAVIVANDHVEPEPCGNMVKVPPLVAAGLGSCGSSGRAWRLCGGSALPGSRPGHWARSHGLRCSSEPPPRSPILLPFDHFRCNNLHCQLVAMGTSSGDDAESVSIPSVFVSHATGEQPTVTLPLHYR